MLSYRLLSIILSIFFFSTISNVVVAQAVCTNPVYVCNRANPANFPGCNFDQLTLPAIVNDMPCVKGAPANYFGCGISDARNQTWILVQVEETDGSPMTLSITNSSNVQIGASITLPINNQKDICTFMLAHPMECKFQTSNPVLRVSYPLVGRTFLLMVSNTANVATNYTIAKTSGVGKLRLCVFSPDLSPCEAPTAEIISEDRLKEPREEYQNVFRFTGNAPLYFRYKGGNYDYFSQYNDYFQSSYDEKPWKYELSNVYNACGQGTVIGNPAYVLVYDTRNALQTCLPFDKEPSDKAGTNSGRVSGAILTTDRFDEPANAYAFDGDDYIDYVARNNVGRDYIYSVWAKPDILPAGNQLMKILGLGTDNDTEQFVGIVSNNQTGNVPKYVFQSKLRNGTTNQLYLPVTVNEWTHLIAQKTGDSLRFIANNQTVDFKRTYSSEPPMYGNSPKLTIGSGLNHQNGFRGKIDDVKLFIGKMSETLLNTLKDDQSCKIKYCNDTVSVTLPGYQLYNPGTTSVGLSLDLSRATFANYQVGDDVLKQVEGQYFRSFSPTAFQQPDGNFETMTHLSNACGTGEIKDTLVVTVSAKQVDCLAFDEDFTNYFPDKTVTGNAISWATDRFNQPNKSADFNGTSSSVQFPATGKGNENQYSAFAWIKLKPNNNWSETYPVFSWQFTYLVSMFWVEYNETANKWYLGYQSYFDRNVQRVEIPDISNEWHMVGITFDNGQVNFVLDNKYIASATFGNQYESNNNTTFRIGSEPRSWYYFKGQIDDFKLFKGKLDIFEIERLYASSGCNFELCENMPTYQLATSTTPLEIESGEELQLPIRFNDSGPWELNVLNGQRKINDYKLNNEVLKIKGLESGNQVYYVEGVRNHCGYNKSVTEIPVYVKPKLSGCFPLNGNGLNTKGGDQLLFNNIINTQDRFQENAAAVRFNGYNSYASLRFPFYQKGAFSTSFWIKPFAINGTKDVLMTVGLFSYENLAYELIKMPNNLYAFRFSLTSNYLTNIELTTTQTFPLNEWTHFIVTFSINTVQIYANGALIESISYQNPLNRYFTDNNINGEVGRSKLSPNDYYNGDLDDFKVFIGILNPGECEAVANAINRCSFTDCKPVIIIDKPILTTADIQASKLVQIDRQVNVNANLYSKGAVELLPGFETKSSIFKAEIRSCSTD